MLIACGGTTIDSGTPADTGDAATDGVIDSGRPEVDSAPADVTDGGGETPDTGPAPTTVPPPRPPTSSSGGATKWYAFNKLQLGLSDRTTGAVKPTAWRDYGYDLDGRDTTAADSATSKNSCKRVAGSPSKVLTDGTDGIDNNFGQHLMAVVKSLKSDTEDIANKYITDGNFTLILRLDNVSGDDNGTVPGAMYIGGSLGSFPTFTTADSWPITSDSLTDGADIKKPKFVFKNGYMAKGLWVSGDLGTETISLALPIFGGGTVLPLESGVITVKVSDGSFGTMAGGTPSTTLTTAFTPFMKSYGICPGTPTFDIVVQTIEQSADLVSGAPKLQDVTKECNAISIGLGFTMKPTGTPTTVVPPLPPPPSGC